MPCRGSAAHEDQVLGAYTIPRLDVQVNAVQAENPTYGPAWQQPTAVLIARFVKFSVLFDF